MNKYLLIVGFLLFFCKLNWAQKQKNVLKTIPTHTLPKKMIESLPDHKLIIYQITAHLWGNQKSTNKINGSEIENGCGKMADISDIALQTLKNQGYTHVWVMGLIESATLVDHSNIGIENDHPAIVKGRAGSAFAIKDYYDINPNLAIEPSKRMKEFESLVERIHKNGLKLLIDFVPNHVARVYSSDAKPAGVVDFGVNDNIQTIFDPQNNFYYLPGTEFIIPEGVVPAIPQTSFYEEKPAKVTGNDVFKAMPNINDWYETVKLNYGVNILNNRSTHFDPRPDTWNKMTHILQYWMAKGVDGFRCDMAEMVPVQFWKHAIGTVKKQYPKAVFVAEIYNPNEYKNYIKTGGFDYLYDKVGLYDALRRLIEDQANANTADLTHVWQKESGDIGHNMLRFLENHDEQRIASEFFAKDPFKALPAMLLSATMHNGPLMVYFGQELGEPAADAEGFGTKDGRTTMFDFWGVKTQQRWLNEGKFDGKMLTENELKLQKNYLKIIDLSKKNEAISKGHFFDLQYANEYKGALKSKIYAYLRYTQNQKLLFIYNFDHKNEQNFSLQIPELALQMMQLKDNKVVKITTLHQENSNKNSVKLNQTFLDCKIQANSAIVLKIN